MVDELEHIKEQLYDLAHRSLGLVIVESGLLVLIALTALVGNSCVLYVFYKTPRLRTATSYYFINLAISDVAMAILPMPVMIVAASTGRDVSGAGFGEAFHWILTELTFSSLQITTLIAINRYVCIIKPALYPKYFKLKIVILTIMACWIFTLAELAGLYLSGFAKFQFYPGLLMYSPYFPSYKSAIRIIMVVVEVVFGLFPSILITFCYWKISKHVKNHNAQVIPNLHADGPQDFRNNLSLAKKELQLTGSLVALVVAFAFGWIPASIVYQLSAYMKLARPVEMIVIYTTTLRSAINPFLYNRLNKHFRRRFVQLLSPKIFFVQVGSDRNPPGN